ncbi:hypothetical protein FA592_03025 [Sulfurospirillum diekertiae]|uniref:Cas10/Cmr2 second palm domain-containing protein n=1 Tax=Sulfurospirillum diekertiae TaxID=1854492 RepID=A0A6G9VP11_9BACT|nr:hypothetical protein [Sulfurospirillum diekertiae]QIR75254.1 hypothetical protein FA584_03125 [Sulfurospirillum diekertiae]QIR77905.1 hypothetical protein FA592_03025 [Sulfurospirillum diekertiae]
MAKYLYGASIQGIQEFIFKTNQLQEIIGASEIVRSLEGEFTAFANVADENILLNAAGNIKALFDDEENLRNVVKNFPKKIMQKAYGITLSQAVVDMTKAEYDTYEKAINALEKKLKTQRNKPSIPLDISINLMELAPKTARPVAKIEKKGNDEIRMDVSTAQKYQANPTNKGQLSDLKNSKGKIAIIHADGNGLGALIPTLSNIPVFSKGLDKATHEAYEEAKKVIQSGKIRKIILGGDDMSVICDANDALAFTRTFLEKFETLTYMHTGHKLTACAGIAFCNEKYPFHYAVSLAEALCGATKKHAKNIDKKLAPSSLMFHNIQSSNFQSWEKFIEDELTIRNDHDVIRCDFGPYYVAHVGQPSIEDLIDVVKVYQQEGSPISRLREWLGELSKSHHYAKDLLDRINENSAQNDKKALDTLNLKLKKVHPALGTQTMIIPKDGFDKTLIYDVLQILSVTEAKA